MYTTLIKPHELAAVPDRDAIRTVDCRFDLQDPAAGRRAYTQAHIPGAVYASLDEDLSGDPVTDHGRHPLPAADTLCSTFGRLGIAPGTQVVAYDAANGMVAARLWWMLRYLGHAAVAVLDGGWQAWCAAGMPRTAGEETAAPATFTGSARRDRLVTLAELTPGPELVDARDPRRYRGETEPLDPRAGHIPAARNHCFANNLDADGSFREPAALRRAFTATLATLPTSTTVHYCRSGVSACHNVLAQVHAGLEEPRLYCGSWSEWCSNPERPAAVGEDD
jgi:thiosulfate/3-mercaptopyruvate sulfurtransferase